MPLSSAICLTHACLTHPGPLRRRRTYRRVWSEPRGLRPRPRRATGNSGVGVRPSSFFSWGSSLAARLLGNASGQYSVTKTPTQKRISRRHFPTWGSVRIVRVCLLGNRLSHSMHAKLSGAVALAICPTYRVARPSHWWWRKRRSGSGDPDASTSTPSGSAIWCSACTRRKTRIR